MKKLFALAASALVCAASWGATDLRQGVAPFVKSAPRNGAIERAEGAMPRRAFAALKSSPLRAASSDEVVEIYTDSYNSAWVHYEYSGDWYCTFMAEANGDMYDFHLDVYADQLPGHYTEADLDDYYTWCRKNDVEFHFTEADITITESSVAPDQYEIDATVKTTLDETLHIVVKPGAPSTEDINMEGDELVSSYFYGPDWSISFEQYDRYRIMLDMENAENPGNLEGTYTTDNCWLEYCTFYDMQTGVERLFKELNFTVVGNDPKGNIEITGTGVLEDDINVSFHFLQTLPIEPAETIALNDATLESFLFHDPSVTHKASLKVRSEEQQVEINLAYDGTKGTFTEFYWMFCSLTDLRTGEVVALDNGQMTVSVDDENQVNVQAELVFKNAIAYTFDVTRQLEIAGQKSVEVHNMTITNLAGLINYLIGSNDEYTRVQASTMMDLAEGDYTNSMVFVLEAVDGSYCSSLVVKEAALTQHEDGNFDLAAKFLGDDMVDYTLYMDYYVPGIESEDTFTSTAGMLRDLTADYGAFQIVATDVTGEDYFSIVLDDWYVHSAQYSALSAPNRDYCQIIRHLGQPDQEVLPLYTCNVSLIVDGNDFTLEGTCQAGSVLYTIDVKGQLETEEPTGDVYDDSENDLNLSFSTEEVYRYEVLPEQGYAVIGARNDAGQSFLTLIYLNGDELTAGDYEITNTYAPGTVQAGSVSGNSAYPTLVAQYDEEGNITIPLWLCKSGWVTVSYDAAGEIQLVIDAINSWGRMAHVTLNESGTVGIETLSQDDAQADGKFMLDRQIIIRRDSKLYQMDGILK